MTPPAERGKVGAKSHVRAASSGSGEPHSSLQVDDLSHEERWDRYRAPAVANGVMSSLSLPLIVDGERLGALNLYFATPAAFAGPQRAQAEAFAAQCPAALTLSLRQACQAQVEGEPAVLRARRIPHTIPERDDVRSSRARNGSRGGRPPNFNPERYKDRNQVEAGVQPAQAVPRRRHPLRQA
jgi:hypothetical protein